MKSNVTFLQRFVNLLVVKKRDLAVESHPQGISRFY
jgi:hypothetical protein